MERFIHHALDVRHTDEGIVPLRFSKEQMAFFERTRYKFRSYNAAGICLAFRTDSPFLRLSCRLTVKPGTEERVIFDIYVDEALVACPGQTVAGTGSADWKVPLPVERGRPRQVTVYLPYSAQVELRELSVAEGAVWEQVEPKPRNLLCVGDSITQGMNAVHPSSAYPVQLSRSLNMNLLNQAVSGYVFDACTIDPSMGYKPDLITVAYGTNDWSECRSLEQFEERAGAYIRKLAGIYPQVPIAVLSPIWREDHRETKHTGPFAGIGRTIEQLCGVHDNIRFVDGFPAVPHQPDFYADGLHPNDAGLLHYAMYLTKRLKELVRE
ncbi:SGNH/GDSL hydrolase family protein [Paenibacillus tarimensis]